MTQIPVADTRNIVLLGHTGSGKTTLVDAIMYKAGQNDRLGLTSNGTSMADWTEEKKNGRYQSGPSLSIFSTKRLAANSLT